MDLMLETFLRLFEPTHLAMLITGVIVGLCVGILPGLGGIVGMTILLPIIYGMEPDVAFPLLIGMVAVIPTSDTFPSVMMGIPGSSASQATIMDGYPLAKKGEAARALGAAFTASLIGGLFGATVLSIIIPVARPLVLAFGSPELFMLAVLGMSMVGVLSGDNALKGVLAAGFGVMLGTVGDAPAVAEYRYTFGIDYLMDGVPLVVVGLGLFAFPEIIDLLIQGRSIAEVESLGKGWLDGVKDTLKNKLIVLRCSIIGVIVGFIPGLGGSVVDWIAYGHIIQTTRDRENFGKGDIRGVIAPESANNAKEGGGLIPTFLFGIPGSGSMAVFLGGLLILGIQPGPAMVTEHVDLIYTAVWSLALANVFGAGLSILLSKPITRLTIVPFSYLAPFMILIITFASYQATRSWGDLISLLVLGIMGWLMKRYGWSRPATLIGYVLSRNLETYLFISVQRYGLDWVKRPGVVILAVIIGICIYLSIRFKPKRRSKDRGGIEHETAKA
ncbi:tripartite tricarboxylate transporter permease [Thermodesulforhabdus norvegica]|uniref:TctA family transporter n=1 Tax=Thermodesulforhabdus norvegica TaxID=39841 RepID=A0A1I4QFB3_9BACT|nr:tripartite tricarboxylate transporter permease [Thermodesulforhabdus norvegica]SFM38714.1 TctA family transporter [Thermodesulforhabdus norvegica]